jgi:hypothetical protein
MQHVDEAWIRFEAELIEAFSHEGLQGCVDRLVPELFEWYEVAAQENGVQKSPYDLLGHPREIALAYAMVRRDRVAKTPLLLTIGAVRVRGLWYLVVSTLSAWLGMVGVAYLQLPLSTSPALLPLSPDSALHAATCVFGLILPVLGWSRLPLWQFKQLRNSDFVVGCVLQAFSTMCVSMTAAPLQEFHHLSVMQFVMWPIALNFLIRNSTSRTKRKTHQLRGAVAPAPTSSQNTHERDELQYPTSNPICIYADRTARRHRDHRDSCRNSFSGLRASEGGSEEVIGPFQS